MTNTTSSIRSLSPFPRTLTLYHTATVQHAPNPFHAERINQCLFQAPAVPTPNAASPPPAESVYVQPGQLEEPPTAPDRVQIGAADEKHQLLRGVSSQSTDEKKGATIDGDALV